MRRDQKDTRSRPGGYQEDSSRIPGDQKDTRSIPGGYQEDTRRLPEGYQETRRIPFRKGIDKHLFKNLIARQVPSFFKKNQT
jgi:hypothetical protein